MLTVILYVHVYKDIVVYYLTLVNIFAAYIFPYFTDVSFKQGFCKMVFQIALRFLFLIFIFSPLNIVYAQCSGGDKTYYYKSCITADPGFYINYPWGAPNIPGRTSIGGAVQECHDEVEAYWEGNYPNGEVNATGYRTMSGPFYPKSVFMTVDGVSYQGTMQRWTPISQIEGIFPNNRWKMYLHGYIKEVTWHGCSPFEPAEPEKKYTIELSPVTAQAYGSYLTAIEPDGITRSSVPQNLINKVNLVAEVKDQDGNVVNAAIKLKVTALEGSGGHAQDNHTERNPTQAGKLKVGTLSGDTINIPKSGMVGGIVEFEYAASAISGDHKIEATCTDITCKQIGQDSVWVGIQDLKTLPASSNYTFTGGSCHHQNNHYATERVIKKIQGIGRDYRSQFSNDQFLYFNDISLERGGLFDADSESDCSPLVKANWTATHNLHRTGEDADVRANKAATAIPKANYDEFEEIAALNGCHAGIHKDGTAAQHYHLYCTKKQDKK